MAVAVPASDPAAHRAALLFERHYAAVLGYCSWRLRTRFDAEEAAQTTFARALSALRRGHRPRNERAWLVTIARNVCTTLGTAPHRAAELVGEVPAGVAPEADDGLAPELEAALAALPEGQRRALLLREWHELSYREIAAELGVSVGTVESWIFRARRSLATALGSARRQLGVSGLLRWLGPSAGAKVAAATVVATAVVAAERAVETQSASEPIPGRRDRPAVRAEVARTSGAAPVVSATRTTPAKRRTTASPPKQIHTPVDRPVRTRDAEPGSPTASEAAGAAAAPEKPAPGSTTSPTAPPATVAPAPALPVPDPQLPPVEVPTVPDLPVQPPALPVDPPALPADVPQLPSTSDLPVDLPKLP